ncbi:4-hydroxy-tetrahydrodipicolinate reductase [Ornithinimicrobium panacihumi]|uniref:4-hydroxy-tetrahydrodipicolinate reductase n=1 Tax=Ornithinimicrobium panacihumi TaxID=2008449 RepID=UPI003F88F12B
MTTTVGLFGTGRLGTAIRQIAEPGHVVAWARGRGDEPGPGSLEPASGSVDPAPEPAEPPLAPVDVAIDVSHPDAVADHLAWAGRTGTPLVIGTTGWDPALLRPDQVEIPVLVAPNFSLGVALVRRVAQVLGGYAASLTSSGATADLAVTEVHHRGKVDSPSGTALSLSQALAVGAGRDENDIPTTSLRLGAVVGEHELILTSEQETIRVQHVAHDRHLFAAGALAAADWLTTRAAGVHTLDDLAADLFPPIHPLRTTHQEGQP